MEYCEDCQCDSLRKDFLQCHYCRGYTHTICEGLTKEDLREWKSLRFACRSCAYEEGTYSVEAALVRLTVERLTGRRSALKRQARSEQKLLNTYKVGLPLYVAPSPVVDYVAASLLARYDPDMASMYTALATAGDGNCLYRSVSLALCGTQKYHRYLRLITALEMIVNEDSYNTGKAFNDFIADIRIVTSAYDKLVSDCIQENTFSEMGHLYALSAAIQQPIRSHYPSLPGNEYAEAFSRTVLGRGVSVDSDHLCIMWTSVNMPVVSVDFEVNHFVPLIHCDRIYVAAGSDRGGSEPADVVSVDTASVEAECININSVPGVSFDSMGVEILSTSAETVCVDEASAEADFTDTGSDLDFLLDRSEVFEDPTEQPDAVNVDSVSTDTTSAVPVPSLSFDDDTQTDPTDNCLGDDTTGRLTGVFMETDTLIQILTQGIQGRDEIPGGVKENVYFVMNNDTNATYRKNGKRSDFPDDCGIWDGSKGSSPKTYYVQFGVSYRQAFLKNNLLCYRKKNKGQIQYIPYEPQPEHSMVFPLQRYYTKLKLDNTYQKRVSWLSGFGHNESKAIVEYIGTFPGLSVHGNSTTGNEYVRVPPKVLDEVTQLSGKLKSHQILNRLTEKYDELQQPTGLRQVHDRQYRDRKRENNVDGHRDNIADQIRYIENQVTQNSEFVRSVVRTGGKTPCIILFTDEQIQDIKSLCCTGQTVLGVDKTFMLCKMHVTVTCYKQLSVINPKTGQSPIFLGPMFIHDNSDFETFSHFFHHIKLKLHDVPLTNLVIGTDDEKAMVKAIEAVFPDSTHILCTRHLEENARHILTDDAVTKTRRQQILRRIFGDGGLIDANDSFIYDEQANEIDIELSSVSDKFRQYFKRRLVTTLKRKVNDPTRQNNVIRHWTNNNCESMNHVLKQTVDWKSQTLPDLVTRLQDLVKGQFRKLRSALLQTGDYRLADSHRRFELTKTDWIKMTEKQRLNQYRRYRLFVPTDGKTVTSTDLKTIVMAPKTNGRKPGQRKRKPKTVTVTNKFPRLDNGD